MDRKVLCIIFIVVLMFCTNLNNTLFGQDTGPGGVGTSANMDVWLDASRSGLSDGASVTTWPDVSGNNNHFTQSPGTTTPTFKQVSIINSKPSMIFDGGDFMNSAAIANLGSDVVSAFVVSRSSTSITVGNRLTLLDGVNNSNSTRWRVWYQRDNGSQARIVSTARTSSDAFIFASNVINPVTNSIVTAFQWQNDEDIQVWYNGSLSGAATNTPADGTFGTHSKIILGESNAGSQKFIGRISEVIIFHTELNTAQNTIVQNYLAGKYGITLTSLSKYAFTSTHSNDIAGIGRDDASNQHLSAQGTGDVSMQIGSLDNSDYLLWGHDNLGYSVSSIDIPSSYALTNGNRIDQEWIVAENGDLSNNGNITLTIDITGNEFGDQDEYELLINKDGDGDFSDAIQISGTYLGGIITFTVPASDFDNGSRFTLGNTQKTIISIIDGQDWNQTSTWSCGCLPLIGNDVIIDNGHVVTVSDAQSVNNLTINATGELVIDANATFNVQGDISATGSFTVNSPSMVLLDGSSLQTLDFSGAVTFDSLEVNNAAGVTLNTGTFTFSGVLYPTNGDVDFNGNSVTFLSTATENGIIGPIGGTISGLTNVTSQRFISTGVAGFREVGFPFDASFKLSDWDDEIFISGPGFTDGCAVSGTGQCYTSAKVWNGTKMVGITDLDSIINAGRGVDVYLGDNLNTFASRTMATSKSLNLTNSVDITINNGWNFIANPFLSPIDFDRVTLDGGTGNYFYINDAATGWQWWDGDSQTSSTSDLDSGIIAPYQGFWVFHSGAATTLTIDQDSKAPTAGNPFLKSQLSNANRIGMSILMTDKEIGRTSELISVSGDQVYHGSELPVMPPNLNRGANLASKGNSGNLVKIVDNRGQDCFIIPLNIENVGSDNISLSFSNLPGNSEVVLVDKKSYIIHNIEEGTVVEIEVSDSEDLSDRFEVKVKGVFECEDELDAQDFSAVYVDGSLSLFFENTIETSIITIFNLNGQLVYQGVLSSSNSYRCEAEVLLPDGVYIISVKESDSSVSNCKLVVTK